MSKLQSSNELYNSSMKTIVFSGKTLRRIIKNRYLYLMVAPAFVLVFLFNYVTLFGWVIAFKDYRLGKSIIESEWIGFKFFKQFLLEGSDWGYLLRNTLVMNFSMLIVGMLCAVTFALLINEVRYIKFAKSIQTVSFFPFFISWVIVYSIIHSLFAVSTGAINRLLVEQGWIEKGFNILGDKKYSWGLVVMMSLWKSLGYNAVIYIAAIAGIPPEEYEAAEIDGANRWQRVLHVTIPNLMPTVVVLLIMNSGWILNSNFDMYYLFTNGTNWETMEVLDMYIYKYGLKLGKYPYSIAVGMMKSCVSIALLFAVNMISKRLSEKSIL